MYMYLITHIHSTSFVTKVLQRPGEIQEGMMGKTFRGQPFQALLFVMNRPESSFWMKNCIVPLDVVFIHDGKISKIHHSCKPCTTPTCQMYPGKGELVMEFPGGTCKSIGIKQGQKVVFDIL